MLVIYVCLPEFIHTCILVGLKYNIKVGTVILNIEFIKEITLLFKIICKQNPYFKKHTICLRPNTKFQKSEQPWWLWGATELPRQDAVGLECMPATSVQTDEGRAVTG